MRAVQSLHNKSADDRHNIRLRANPPAADVSPHIPVQSDGQPLAADTVLNLQQTIGNAAVQRLLMSVNPAPSGVIQAGRNKGGNKGKKERPNPLAELQNKIDTTWQATDRKYGDHIFKGDLKKGVPTGYHSENEGSDTHEAYGTSTDLGNGVYQQSVRHRTTFVKKPVQSTFFPPGLSRETVARGITSALESSQKIVKLVPDMNGMQLEKIGDTIFPAGGDDHLAAE